MFKTILVPVTGFESDSSALDTAYLTARPFNAHIQCLHVRSDAAALFARLAADGFTDGTSGVDLLIPLEEEDEERSKRARVAFDEFCKRWAIVVTGSPPGPPGVSAEWREIEGDEIDTTIAEARYYDLTVMGRAPAGALSRDGIGTVLVGSGRPLLLATSSAPENLGGTIAIAWKNAAEASRALTAAAPLFSRAKRIILLTAPEHDAPDIASKSAEKIAMQMRWKGLNAEVRCVELAGRPLPDAVLGTATALGADLLIMGGYGHSRVREFVFGGFTRHVLTASPLPVFLFH